PLPEATHHLCGGCLTNERPYERAVSAFAYGGALADAVARWKNRPDHSLGPRLGRLFVSEAVRAGWFEGGAPTLVVPIPSGRHQLRRRGFNPAGLLARAMA